MTDEVVPVGTEEELPELAPRPRRWWLAGIAIVLAGALLALYVPGLLPGEETGSGTGFVVSGAGHVLTAAHVVEGATEISVYWDGRRHRATTSALSAGHDLALLVMENPPRLPVAVLAAERPEVGDPVTAVGHPGGAARPVSLSTRVAGGGWWAVGPDGDLLQDIVTTEDPFRPGYSGAPLVNAAGQVVGIVAGTVTTTGGQELGFAVSIQQAVAWLAGRGTALALSSDAVSASLGEAEIVALIGPAVVRVEARLPPGSR
jgi:S1-C subfamily serine protease